ncbi:MAG: phage tail tape measure protein [Bacteroidales bacterium]|nr:phage tail tape measure protein [Bacteroidales bacterium]
MAAKTNKETIQLDILVNGNKAQKEYHDLIETQDKLKKEIREHEKAQKDAQKEIEKTAATMKKMTAAGKGESEEYKKLSANIKELHATRGKHAIEIDKGNKQLDANKRRFIELRQEIGLTKLTTMQLIEEKKRLNYILKHTIPNTADAQRYRSELAAIEKQLGTMGKKAEVTKVKLAGFANGFNKYAGMAAAMFAGITQVSTSFRKISQEAAKMDETYSMVSKTTELTKAEVLDLNEAFKKMDTRTAREELNAYAEIAGRIGIRGKENLLMFVEAADLIKTSLGKVLGEDAVQDIAKLAAVFSSTQADLKNLNLKEQILAVGNAITELGNTSTANEQYMINFASRMGGVGVQANLSMQDILGYASVLDQNMLSAEKSSTALSKFIIKLMAEPAKFAEIAGISATVVATDDYVLTHNRAARNFQNKRKQLNP